MRDVVGLNMVLFMFVRMGAEINVAVFKALAMPNGGVLARYEVV